MSVSNTALYKKVAKAVDLSQDQFVARLLLPYVRMPGPWGQAAAHRVARSGAQRQRGDVSSNCATSLD